MSELEYYTPKHYKFVAGVNESEAYEVDVTEIYHDGERFHLLTASGCSCWEGEYDDEAYDTLDELLKQIGIEGDVDRMYNPSFKGAQQLAQEARQWVG